MEELDNLYTVVKDKGLYTKSLEEFKAQYSDPKNQDKLYEVVNSRGYYTKTRDEFQSKYFGSAPEPVKKKEESQSSVSASGSGDSNSGSVSDTPEEVTQELNIPAVDIEDPAVASMYEHYMKSEMLDDEQMEDISEKLSKQKSGDRSLWDIGKAYTKGIMEGQLGGVMGATIPIFNFDSDKDLVEKRAKKNKRSYLEEMPEQDKAKVLSAVQDQGQHLSKENNYIAAQNSVLIARDKQISSQLEQYSTLSEEEIVSLPDEDKQNIQNLYKESVAIKKSYNDNWDIIEGNREDIGTFKEEIDLLKRNYDGFSNFTGSVVNTARSLVAGGMEAASFMNRVGSFGLADEASDAMSKKAEDITNVANKYRALNRVPLTIEDVDTGNFTEWASEQIASQIPVLSVILATGGTTGAALLGASAGGQKSVEMKQENKSGRASYTPTEILFASAGNAVAEFLGETVTAGILSKGKRALLAGGDEVKKGVAKRLWEKSTDIGKDVLEEGLLSEGGTQLVENAIDKYYLGKDVELSDGVWNAIASGGFMALAMRVTPELVGGLTRGYQSDENKTKLKVNVQKFKNIQEQIDKGVDPEVEKELVSLAKNILNENKSILEKDIKNMESKSPEDLEKVSKLNKEIKKEESKAKKIVNNPDIDPDLRESLSERMLKKLNDKKAQKEEIMDPKNKTNDFKEVDAINTKYQEQIDAVKVAKSKETIFKSEKDFKKTIDEGQWGMLTAENPNATKATQEANIAQNKKAKKWLEDKGYTIQEINGKYNNNKENSFFVKDITKEDAIEFAKEFNQESVATNEGLVYQDGSMNPRVKEEDSYGPKEDMYSTIEVGDTKQDFSIGYDWSKKVEGKEVVGLDKADQYLKDIYDRLTKAGNTTLGMNIPVVVAKGTISVMRAAIKAAKSTAAVISAGINHLRGTAWYKNLNADKKNEAEAEVKNLLSKKDYENKTNEYKKLLSGIPIVTYLDEKIFENLVGKPLENMVTNAVKRGLDSKHRALRNISEGYVSWFNGVARTDAETAKKRRMKGEQESAYVVGSKITKELQQIIAFDPEAAKRVHNVMDPELYLEEERITYDDLSDSEKMLHDMLREINNETHEQNYEQGFISDETYEKFKDKYIGRGYEIYDDIVDGISKDKNIFNKINDKIFRRRKEVDDWKIDNKITDPIYLTVNRMIQSERNFAVKRYADGIAETDMVKDVPQAGYTLMEGKAYGALKGKYVPDYIAEDFMGYFFANSIMDKIYEASQAYDKTVFRQFLKKYHTVYNPVVQLGNLMSNTAFAAAAGVNIVQMMGHMNSANKAIKGQTADYMTLLENGIIGSNVLTPDLTLTNEAQRKLILKKKNKIVKTIKDMDDWAKRTYAHSDDIMKMSAYLSLKDAGYTEAEAIQRVYEGFQNYATVGKIWDLSSKFPVFGNAYIKFQADLMRIVKNDVLKRPLTTATFLAGIKLMTLLASQQLSDETEDEREIREARPFIPKIKIPVVDDIPLVMRVGNKEINLARYISPYYNYDIPNKDWLESLSSLTPIEIVVDEAKEMGQTTKRLGTPDVFLGPFWAAFMDNKDFRQKSITDPYATRYKESGLTDEEKLYNKFEYTVRSVVPLASFGQDLYKAYLYGEDHYNRDKSVGDILASRIVKIQTWDDKSLKKTVESSYKTIVYNAQSINKKIKAVEDKYKRDVEDYSTRLERGRMSKEHFNNNVEKLKKDAQKRILKQQTLLVKEQEKMNKLIERINGMNLNLEK